MSSRFNWAVVISVLVVAGFGVNYSKRIGVWEEVLGVLLWFAIAIGIVIGLRYLWWKWKIERKGK